MHVARRRLLQPRRNRTRVTLPDESVTGAKPGLGQPSSRGQGVEAALDKAADVVLAPVVESVGEQVQVMTLGDGHEHVSAHHRDPLGVAGGGDEAPSDGVDRRPLQDRGLGGRTILEEGAGVDARAAGHVEDRGRGQGTSCAFVGDRSADEPWR